MDNVKKIKENHSGESFYSDTNAIEQLRDYSRNLSQRVKLLEQYKLLCEQRIQELFPNHPLPIKEDHLGLYPSSLSELNFAKQKISRLESQIIQKSYSMNDNPETNESFNFQLKINELLKEKNHLEESLRAEMLTCEEQRTYIEILKQAFEQHLGNFTEFKADPQALKELIGPKSTNNELKRDFANLKNEVMDKDSQIEKLNNYIKNNEKQVEAIVSEKQQLEIHLKEAAETLQIAEDEVMKLEEEKTSLLDYIDEHSQKEQEMEKEMNELGKLFEEMKENYNNTIKKFEEERGENQILEKDLDHFKREHAKLSSNTKDLQENITSLKAKIQEKESLSKKLKEENISYDAKNESLFANITTLNETIKELQFENESYQQKIKTFEKRNSEKEEKIHQLKIENSNVQIENKKFKEKILNIETDREIENEEKAEIEKLLDENKNYLEEYKSKINELKNRCDSLEEDKKIRIENERVLRIDSNKLSQAQKELNKTIYEYQQAQHKVKNQSDEIENLRQKNNELASSLDNNYLEKQRIDLELNKKTQEIEINIKKIGQITNSCEKLQDENRLLERLLQEEKNVQKILRDQLLSEKNSFEMNIQELKDAIHELQEYEYRYKATEKNLEFITRQLNMKQNELNDEKNTSSQLKEELASNIYRLELKEIERLTAASQISKCCNLIMSSFYREDINLEQYYPLITTNFKNSINSIQNQPNYSINDLLLYTEYSIEEIQYLLEIVADLKEEVNSKNNELTITLSRLEGVNSELSSYKHQLSILSQQINTLHQEKTYISNISNKDIQELKTIKNELTKKKSELEGFAEDNYNLEMSLQQLISENQKLKMNAEMMMTSLKNQEHQNMLLKTEKSQLENALNMQHERIETIEANSIYNDVLRLKSDLELLERERLNIECQLLKLDSEPRSKDSLIYRELNQKLSICEGRIQSYKKCMFNLESNLGREDTLQYHKAISRYASGNQIFNPSLLRHTESPPKRERSPFS